MVSNVSFCRINCWAFLRNSHSNRQVKLILISFVFRIEQIIVMYLMFFNKTEAELLKLESPNEICTRS